MIDELLVPKACREAMLILDVLPRHYRRKIPRDIYLRIREMQDLSHHPHWETTLTAKSDTENLDLLRETVVLISWLNLEFWERSEEEKQRLRAIYQQNDEK